MIVKKQGGMTEFIPSPQEKRDGLIRDRILEITHNLHHRLVLLESKCELNCSLAEKYEILVKELKDEEVRNVEINCLLKK